MRGRGHVIGVAVLALACLVPGGAVASPAVAARGRREPRRGARVLDAGADGGGEAARSGPRPSRRSPTRGPARPGPRGRATQSCGPRARTTPRRRSTTRRRLASARTARSSAPITGRRQFRLLGHRRQRAEREHCVDGGALHLRHRPGSALRPTSCSCPPTTWAPSRSGVGRAGRLRDRLLDHRAAATLATTSARCAWRSRSGRKTARREAQVQPQEDQAGQAAALQAQAGAGPIQDKVGARGIVFSQDSGDRTRTTRSAIRSSRSRASTASTSSAAPRR